MSSDDRLAPICWNDCCLGVRMSLIQIWVSSWLSSFPISYPSVPNPMMPATVGGVCCGCLEAPLIPLFLRKMGRNGYYRLDHLGCEVLAIVGLRGLRRFSPGLKMRLRRLGCRWMRGVRLIRSRSAVGIGRFAGVWLGLS